MRWTAILLCLQVGQAQAQALYKCVGPKGVVSYQSEPCSNAERVAKIYDATPEQLTAAQHRERQRRAQEVQLRAQRLSQLAGTDQPATYNRPSNTVTQRDHKQAECSAAKANRESTLRAVGLRRTYELLQQLDAQVYQACKGL